MAIINGQQLELVIDAVSDAIQFARDNQDENKEYKKKKERYLALYNELCEMSIYQKSK